jgi:hypothetical protein
MDISELKLFIYRRYYIILLTDIRSNAGGETKIQPDGARKTKSRRHLWFVPIADTRINTTHSFA